MRPVVLAMQLSADGFVTAAGGETGWILEGLSPDLQQHLCEHLEAADTMLMGRATYEEQAAVWPALRGRMADAVNAHEKVVFTSTAPRPSWSGTRFTSRSPAAEVGALRMREGRMIAVSGGPTLVSALLEADLLDELMLTVHPVALGTGRRLFTGRHRFRLASTERFHSGAVVHRYRRHGERRAGP